jgi:phospholipase C
LHHIAGISEGELAMMTRRDALKLLGLGGLSIAGCKTADGSDDTNQTEGAFFHCVGHDDNEALARAAGVSPAEFRRYEKIVIVMMENRSFDHYFGHLSMPRELGGEGRTDVDGLKGNEFQILDRGNGPERFGLVHPNTFRLGDITHEWDPCHGQFNNGAMDGFIKMHFQDLQKQNGDRECGKTCAALGDPMSFYTRNDTPIFHQLLDNYTLCDRWFSSVMGPTWPNRMYLHCATSTGIKKNERMDIDSHPNGPNQARTIWHELHDKCISAMNYAVDFAFNLGGFGLFNSTPTGKVFNWQKNNNNGDHGGNENEPDTFEEACQKGTLPIVSMIDPGFIQTPTDDHPPHDVGAGQAFVSSIYKMLTANEAQWSKTLLIITYDEHGSFYDHVAPPKVMEDERPEFQQLGFRVPALIVGPYVKKNHVSHVQYDHVSFLSTITRRLGLTPLNKRVVTANDVRDCIDMNAVETSQFPPTPVQLRSINLSESLVHESIRESLGQSELALAVQGRPALLEEKRRATDQILATYDRLGVARIGR